MHSLLEQSVLPADVQATLLERAGGNPLYAGEFVRMLADRGAGGLSLPESVQGVIAARLDGLEAGDKALLQDAAVVGKVFWTGALEAIAPRGEAANEERLHGLARKAFVRRERRSAVGGEEQYAFEHVLVRDAIVTAGRCVWRRMRARTCCRRRAGGSSPRATARPRPRPRCCSRSSPGSGVTPDGRTAAFLADVEAGSPHYMEAGVRSDRARIWLARGDVGAALEESVRALELARGLGDPQSVFPTLASHAFLLHEAEPSERASGYLDELLALWRELRFKPSWWLVDAAFVSSALGRGEEFLTLAGEARPQTRWVDAGVAYVRGDPSRAAENLGEMGVLPYEAYVRLRAAAAFVEEGRRAEADEQLAQALAYYRSVGATRYIREGEALLAATA